MQHANGLTSGFLKIGRELKIPTTNPVKASAAGASNGTYVVKSGDCLSVIGARFHLSVAKLQSMNHLTSDTIYTGQTLKVGNSPANTSVTQVSASSTTTAAKVQGIVADAEKYMGVPYLWGGNTPAGFDCSGFVKYIFAKFGVSLPRTTWDQWNATQPAGSPSIGDLVFFQTYKMGPSHVGIYLGDNKFISAASTGVTISDLTSTYWKTRYLGARSAL